jgi:hypothetical protein
MDQANNTIVTINDLLPSTDYDVYCYTEDFNEHYMDLEAVKITKVSKTSLCCREISFSTVHTSITEYDVDNGLSEDIFSFAIDTVPLENTVVKIDLIAYDCNKVAFVESSIATSIPSSFVFDSNSNSLSGRFRINGSIGCYYFTTYSFNGTSYQNISATLVINSKDAAPNPPLITSVLLGNKGQKLYVSFDSSTDQSQGVFSQGCYHFFNFSGVALATCLWVTNSEAIISLGSAASIEIDGEFVLFDDVIKAECTGILDCSDYVSLLIYYLI